MFEVIWTTVSEVLYVCLLKITHQVFTVFIGGLEKNLPDSARRKKIFLGDSLFGLTPGTQNFFARGQRLVRD